MSILGSHRVRAARSYSVLRVQGVLTIGWSILFASAIMLGGGLMIGTPGWAPLRDFMGSHLFIGGVLMAAGLLGILGLAFDDDDRHSWPRMVSVTSAAIGILWCGVISFAFAWAWIRGWVNAGPFLAAPGVVLHTTRFYLLIEKP